MKFLTPRKNNWHQLIRKFNHQTTRSLHGHGLSNHLQFSSQGATTTEQKLLINEHNNSQRKKFNILAIDGGGIRGVFPLKVISEIERITGKPIADSFDLIAGTSTGGIIALGLTTPADKIESEQNDQSIKHPKYSADQLLELYKTNGKYIFGPSASFVNVSETIYSVLVQATTCFVLSSWTGSAATTHGMLLSLIFKEPPPRYLNYISALSTAIIMHYHIFFEFSGEMLIEFISGVIAGKILDKIIFKHFEPYYDKISLLLILNEYFQDTKFSKALKPLLITSYNASHENRKCF